MIDTEAVEVLIIQLHGPIGSSDSESTGTEVELGDNNGARSRGAIGREGRKIGGELEVVKMSRKGSEVN